MVIEIEYEVLKPGHVLLAHHNIYNEEGVFIFPTLDMDPVWRNRPRPTGRYVSQVLIPGNFLRDGTVYVSPALITPDPLSVQFYERDAVAFHVIDNFDGNSARGDWKGSLEGAVRPLLKWKTEHLRDVRTHSIP